MPDQDPLWMTEDEVAEFIGALIETECQRHQTEHGYKSQVITHLSLRTFYGGALNKQWKRLVVGMLFVPDDSNYKVGIYREASINIDEFTTEAIERACVDMVRRCAEFYRLLQFNSITLGFSPINDLAPL